MVANHGFIVRYPRRTHAFENAEDEAVCVWGRGGAGEQPQPLRNNTVLLFFLFRAITHTSRMAVLRPRRMLESADHTVKLISPSYDLSRSTTASHEPVPALASAYASAISAARSTTARLSHVGTRAGK